MFCRGRTGHLASADQFDGNCLTGSLALHFSLIVQAPGCQHQHDLIGTELPLHRLVCEYERLVFAG